MGMKHAVYLDHNATTAVRAAAQEAIARALELTGNASSVHRFGRAVRRLVEDARDAVAALAGAEPAQVGFTSGGGAPQPGAEAAAVARRHGAIVHCDAVQAAGKIALDIKALGVDMVSLS